MSNKNNGLYWECINCKQKLFFEFNEPGNICRGCRYEIEEYESTLDIDFCDRCHRKSFKEPICDKCKNKIYTQTHIIKN